MNCREVHEQEILEGYLLDRLTESERGEFEQHYFECESCFSELQNTRMLQEELRRQPVVRAQARGVPLRRMWTWAPAFMTLALLLVVGTWWYSARKRPYPQQVSSSPRHSHPEVPAQAQPSSELTRQLQSPTPGQSATIQAPANSVNVVEPRQKSQPPVKIPLIGTFTLSIGSERGDSGLNEFSIPARVGRVRLKIPLSKNDYKKYRVTVKKPEGEQVLVRDAMPVASGKRLVIESPIGVLSDGDYILYVTGVDSAGEAKAVVDRYPIRFTHVRKP